MLVPFRGVGIQGRKGACLLSEGSCCAVPKQLLSRVPPPCPLSAGGRSARWPRSPPCLWPEPSLATSSGVTRLTPVSPASPPRCAVLECTHICSIDYTVVLGLGELLEDFHKQGVTLAFVGLQVGEPRAAAHPQ